ncbi:MAG: hypothetical protein QOH43_1664 [Solirubrobacteraceae bacterium]|jgi:hypothetical protein|nr:hypothetical protein [Solirubrobacteraceae bacterium]
MQGAVLPEAVHLVATTQRRDGGVELHSGRASFVGGSRRVLPFAGPAKLGQARHLRVGHLPHPAGGQA